MATRILFLAAHLQPYLVSGINSLLSQYDVEVLIYAADRPENKLLCFSPDARLKLLTYESKPDTFFRKEIELFKPDIVYCAGWMFGIYVRWCSELKKSGVKTICAMDTQWKATLKQRVMVLLSSLLIHKAFSHAWVPGIRQEQYALRLGFSLSNILRFLYAADTTLFTQSYLSFLNSKTSIFPKRFLYVGRLEPHKLSNLLEAFHSLSDAERGLWHLQIVGNGSLESSSLLQHVAIDLLPFLPQIELQKLAEHAAVFCLCSADEPWGTVVQEFAAAGMPMLLSQQCGSSAHFLDRNGFLCDGSDVASIKNGLLKMISSSDQALFEMGITSHQLGSASNSDTWASELMGLV